MKKKLSFLMALVAMWLYTGSVWAQETIIESPWTGMAIENGNAYYLYNIKAQAFLKGANSWGTRASFGEDAIAFIAEGEGNVYALSSTLSYAGKYLGENLFVDSPKADYVFDEVADGIYTFNLNGAYYAYTGLNTVETVTEVTDGCYWQLLTADAIKEQMAIANVANPYIVTTLISGANFNRNNQANSVWIGSPATGGDNPNYCAEKWGAGAFDVNQTLTGLPNGTYLLQAQGFYRVGGGANDATLAVEQYAAGDPALNAILYGNDAEMPLMSIMAEAKAGNAPNGNYFSTSLGYVPQNMTGASLFFSEGLYEHAMYVTVTDGTLKIGVKKSVELANDWVIFDNFRLTYYGNASVGEIEASKLQDYIDEVAALIAAAQAVEPTYSKGAKAELDVAVAVGEAAIAAPTKEGLVAAVAPLEAAIARAERSVAINVVAGSATLTAPVPFTQFVTNPDMADGTINGWTAASGWQFQSNTVYTGEGAELNKFQERWNAGTGLGNTSTMQALKDMPNGIYRVSADVMATAQYNADPEGYVTGAYWVANKDSVAVATANEKPERVSVDVMVTDGVLNIGLVGVNTTANWMGLDNVTVVYYGAEGSLEDMDKQEYIDAFNVQCVELASLADTYSTIHLIPAVSERFFAVQEPAFAIYESVSVAPVDTLIYYTVLLQETTAYVKAMDAKYNEWKTVLLSCYDAQDSITTASPEATVAFAEVVDRHAAYQWSMPAATTAEMDTLIAELNDALEAFLIAARPEDTPEVSIVYTMVQNEADLVAGGKYLIMTEIDGGWVALSDLSGKIRVPSDTLIISDNFTVEAVVATAIAESPAKFEGVAYALTLEGEAGAWKFKDELNGAYLHWASGNYLVNDAEGSTWTIKFNQYAHNAVIAHAVTTGRVLQYNASSPRFCAYTSAQTPVYLFKAGEVTVPPVAPSNPSFNTIAELLAFETGNVVELNVNKANITYLSGNNMSITDGVDTLAVYDYSIPADYAVGGGLSGKITATLGEYKGNKQLTVVDWSEVTFKAPVTVESPWVGTTIENGVTYYLYNVKAQAFLKGANSWGTRASFGQDAYPYIAEGSNDVYALSSKLSFSGKYLGANLFVDSDKANFVFEEVGEGIYTFNLNGAYYAYTGASTVETVTEVNDGCYWQLLTANAIKEQMLAADENNPYDVTALIPGANFGRNNAQNGSWTGSPMLGGDFTNYCAEKWNAGVVTVSQTLTSMPSGTYRLDVQGFYRMGGIEVAGEARTAGREKLYANFFANGDSITVMSIMEECGKMTEGVQYGEYDWVPNDMQQASNAFTAGLYEHSMYFTVAEGDSIIDFGVGKTGSIANDWVAFDNFRLTYYGTASVGEIEASKKQEYIDAFRAQYVELEMLTETYSTIHMIPAVGEKFFAVQEQAYGMQDTLYGISVDTLVYYTEMMQETADYVKAMDAKYNAWKTVLFSCYDTQDCITTASSEATAAFAEVVDKHAAYQWSMPAATTAEMDTLIMELNEAQEAFLIAARPGETPEGVWTDITAERLVNGDMSSEEGWALVNVTDHEAETYRFLGFYSGWDALEVTSSSVKQEVSLPAGQYRLTGSAFYRAGVKYNVDPAKSLGYMVAGDNKVLVKTLGSVEGLNSYADNIVGAYNAFYLDSLYTNVLEFTLDVDTVLSIGYECEFDEIRSWMGIGAMKLEKLYTVKDRFIEVKDEYDMLAGNCMSLYSLSGVNARYMEISDRSWALISNIDSVSTEEMEALIPVMVEMIAEVKEIEAYFNDVFTPVKFACYDIQDNSTAKTQEIAAAFEEVVSLTYNMGAVENLEDLQMLVDALEMARRQYVVNAVPTNGFTFDYTFLVEGVGNSAYGWTRDFSGGNFQYMNSSNKNTETLKKTGYVEAWNSTSYAGTISYTATGIPNGYYTVSAYAFTNGITSFFANNGVAMVDSTTMYVKPVVDSVLVTDGTMAFGLNIESASWVGLTNIELAFVDAVSADLLYGAKREAFIERYTAMEIFSQESLNYSWNGINNNYFWPVMDEALAIRDAIDFVTDIALLDSMIFAMDNAEATVLEAYAVGERYNNIRNLFWDAADHSTPVNDEVRMAMETALENSNYASYMIATVWELEKAAADIKAAYLAYVTNAVPNEGFKFDVTFMINNPSFESGTLSGWRTIMANDTGVKPNADATYTMENCDGNYLFNTWYGTGLYLKQNIQDLPVGVYELGVVLASDAGVLLDVTVGDAVAYQHVCESGKTIGDEVIVKFVHEGGALPIGVSTVNNDWFKADNFRLYSLGASTPEPEKILGDVNGDMQLTMSDVVMQVNAVLNIVQDNYDEEVADMNGDGQITIVDVVSVLRLVLGYESMASARSMDREAAVVAIEAGSAMAGSNGEIILPVYMNSEAVYTAFQMDVVLPEGMSLTNATLGARAKSSHSIAWSTLDNGIIRVVAFAMDNATFNDNTEALAYLTLKVEAAVADDAVLTLTEGLFATMNGAEDRADDVAWRTGDETTSINSMGTACRIYGTEGAVVVESTTDTTISVYTATGQLASQADVKTGKNSIVLPAGIYVVNNQKVIVK